MRTISASETDHARGRPKAKARAETLKDVVKPAKRRRMYAVVFIALAIAAFLATPAIALAAEDSLASATDDSGSRSGDSQKKIAIPSIDKTVSAGGAWSKEVSAQSGTALYYRIVATLPENVDDWPTLVYRIVDNPASGVTMDWKTLVAHIESSSGKLKSTLSPSSTSTGTSTVIELGNLKETNPSLVFGDVVVIEYVARLPASTQAGTYRNVAHLEYQVDQSWLSTVDVNATARIPESPNGGGGGGSGGSGSTFAKTGYFLMRFWWVLALAGVSLIGIGVALNRTSHENDREE